MSSTEGGGSQVRDGNQPPPGQGDTTSGPSSKRRSSSVRTPPLTSDDPSSNSNSNTQAPPLKQIVSRVIGDLLSNSPQQVILDEEEREIVCRAVQTACQEILDKRKREQEQAQREQAQASASTSTSTTAAVAGLPASAARAQDCQNEDEEEGPPKVNVASKFASSPSSRKRTATANLKDDSNYETDDAKRQRVTQDEALARKAQMKELYAQTREMKLTQADYQKALELQKMFDRQAAESSSKTAPAAAPPSPGGRSNSTASSLSSSKKQTTATAASCSTDSTARHIEEQMLAEPFGKAWKLVEKVIEICKGFPGFEAVSTDDLVFLALDMLNRQDEMESISICHHVDIGYHYTSSANLSKIRQGGLMNRKEQDKNGVTPKKRTGAVFGDGIYTGDNPLDFKSYGDMGLIVARLPGEAKRIRHKLGPCLVLPNSSHCVPLVHFKRSDCHKVELMKKAQLALGKVVDEIFNQGSNGYRCVTESNNLSAPLRPMESAVEHLKRVEDFRRRHPDRYTATLSAQAQNFPHAHFPVTQAQLNAAAKAHQPAPATAAFTSEQSLKGTRDLVQALEHAAQCRDPNCSRGTECSQMKEMIRHVKSCALHGQCVGCRRFRAVVRLHANECRQQYRCAVPFCKAAGITIRQEKTQQLSFDDRRRLAMNRRFSGEPSASPVQEAPSPSGSTLTSNQESTRNSVASGSTAVQSNTQEQRATVERLHNRLRGIKKLSTSASTAQSKVRFELSNQDNGSDTQGTEASSPRPGLSRQRSLEIRGAVEWMQSMEKSRGNSQEQKIEIKPVENDEERHTALMEERRKLNPDGSKTRRQKLHEEVLEDLAERLWDMEFPSVRGDNPFRVVIERENCAAVGFPDYFSVVETPMNLTYIKERVQALHYDTFAEFQADVDLIIDNAIRYKASSSNAYHIAAKVLRRRWNKMLGKLKEDSNLSDLIVP